jgi:23S rRNA (cytidine1920-2'-O)/16S rRNA (cytidine1409-2'-O)-methyltransferase
MAASRQRAAEAIGSGRVLVSGAVAMKPSRLVDPGEPIELVGEGLPFVSRGGLKLAAALDAFGIDPRGRRCLDLGASTGGFTDVLLQRGAVHVLAVDVGTGQLDWSLRTHPRVTSLERTDVRELEPDEPVDLVVADLSFISLRTVMASIAAAAGDADVILLVKPQFEVGRARIGKGGIVRDPAAHRHAVDAVRDAAAAHGLSARGEIESPVPGTEGNKEFFLWVRKP